MTQVEYVKAFTQSPEKGNPAGVVIRDSQLAETAMPEIARRVGFTATAFLAPLGDGSIKIRFFSPRAESALCVHALLASAERWNALKGWNGPITFHAMRDDFLVERRSNGAFMVTMPKPIFGRTIEDISRIATILGVASNSIDDLPIQIVGTGKPKILIPIRSLETLLSITPDEQTVIELCKEVGAEGIFPFARETLNPTSTFHARHWNPMALECEDPICGNASGALAAYLEKNNISPGSRFVVEMGVSSKLPGEVLVEQSDAIQVGGFAVKFDEVEI